MCIRAIYVWSTLPAFPARLPAGLPPGYHEFLILIALVLTLYLLDSGPIHELYCHIVGYLLSNSPQMHIFGALDWREYPEYRM